jgi:hypothetical protein
MNIRKTMPILLVLLMTLLLVGCGQKATRERSLDLTLKGYAKVVRWNEFERALKFIDPELKEKLTPKGVEWERYSQIKVSGYQEAPPVTEEDGTVTSVVRIEVYNIHTLKERAITDRQSWRYDEEAKNWFLTTGLPKLVE